MREAIARSRFKWKSVPWMQPEKIRAIWIRSQEGRLSYEYEFTEPIQPRPEMPPSARMPIKDDVLLTEIEKHMLDFDVSGAIGNGLIVGELEVPIGSGHKRVQIRSDLKEWRDWLENKRLFKLRGK
jgi:hypothetical protein